MFFPWGQDDESDSSSPDKKRARIDSDNVDGANANVQPVPVVVAPSSSWTGLSAAVSAPFQPITPSIGLMGQPPVVMNNENARLERRRRKNAEQARITRERKRNQELLLKQDLALLERENDRLKELVKAQLPEQAQAIIGDCCFRPDGKGSFLGQESSKLLHSDFELIESLTKTRQSFVLTDPRLPDNPIVYASRQFLSLTGYERDQVVGRNCRFLQGLDTDPAAVAEIHDAIAVGKDGACCLLNYRADGTPFWNQFFVAPLRDKDNQIINFVGVQNKVEKPDERVAAQEAAACLPSKQPVPVDPMQQTKQRLEPTEPVHSHEKPLMGDVDVDYMDWAELAEVLELDFQESEGLLGDGDDSLKSGMASGGISVIGAHACETDMAYLEQALRNSPREFVTRTVRSDLIDALLSSNGDVNDKRFLSALDVLTDLFESSLNFNTSQSAVLNGSWRSISRPVFHYGGCVGKNENGDFLYTLGKMCFNMFKPGNARCSVQHTMNHIEPVCRMGKTPSAAPWSLRRELALGDPETSPAQTNAMLKSYDIVIAFTIEPGQFMAGKNEVIPSPRCRLKATHVVRGYFLPDPKTPNRLTVWFTGGELAPIPPTEEDYQNGYGGLKDWFEYFGAEYSRTWGQAVSVMGAKLFLGAELPNEMDSNGKMEYTLHRPYGGHGRGYADVLYVDGDLLVTKGNSGSIHVMVAQH